KMTFSGQGDGIVVQANAALEGSHIDASLDVPDVSPAEARALLPASPLTETAAVHAEVHGELPDLGVVAHARLGGGTLDVTGFVGLASVLTAKLHLDGAGID